MSSITAINNQTVSLKINDSQIQEELEKLNELMQLFDDKPSSSLLFDIQEVCKSINSIPGVPTYISNVANQIMTNLPNANLLDPIEVINLEKDRGTVSAIIDALNQPGEYGSNKFTVIEKTYETNYLISFCKKHGFPLFVFDKTLESNLAEITRGSSTLSQKAQQIASKYETDIELSLSGQVSPNLISDGNALIDSIKSS